jgi:hypothetical protein
MKNLNTASIGGQVAPALNLAIPAMLSNLYESLAQLEQNNEILHCRLNPVLQTPMVSDGDSEKKQDSISEARSVPHAEQLESIKSRVDRRNNLTIDVLNRLHV